MYYEVDRTWVPSLLGLWLLVSAPTWSQGPGGLLWLGSCLLWILSPSPSLLAPPHSHTLFKINKQNLKRNKKQLAENRCFCALATLPVAPSAVLVQGYICYEPISAQWIFWNLKLMKKYLACILIYEQLTFYIWVLRHFLKAKFGNSSSSSKNKSRGFHLLITESVT